MVKLLAFSMLTILTSSTAFADEETSAEPITTKSIVEVGIGKPPISVRFKNGETVVLRLKPSDKAKLCAEGTLKVGRQMEMPAEVDTVETVAPSVEAIKVSGQIKTPIALVDDQEVVKTAEEEKKPQLAALTPPATDEKSKLACEVCDSVPAFVKYALPVVGALIGGGIMSYAYPDQYNKKNGRIAVDAAPKGVVIGLGAGFLTAVLIDLFD